jgi:hypothetical protein
MKIIVILSAMLLIMTGDGCGPRGARSMYEGLRLYQEMDCQSLQGADRDDCSRRAGMSYDEYQRLLKEREQDK